MSSYLLTKSALFCIDFRSTAVCMQCVRTKSYRWTTFLFSFKSNPRWNKLTSASVGLLIWSGSTTSCILLFEQEAFNEFTLVEPIGGNLPTCSHMPLAMLCREEVVLRQWALFLFFSLDEVPVCIQHGCQSLLLVYVSGHLLTIFSPLNWKEVWYNQPGRGGGGMSARIFFRKKLQWIFFLESKYNWLKWWLFIKQLLNTCRDSQVSWFDTYFPLVVH